MTNYYFYMGYNDGSGKPQGYIIKYYTDEQYLYYTKKCGLILVLIKKEIRRNG